LSLEACSQTNLTSGDFANYRIIMVKDTRSVSFTPSKGRRHTVGKFQAIFIFEICIFMKKMKPSEFIALSASSMALTALGIDIMLPVLAELRNHFGLPTNSTATAQVITFFFMGQVAQIVFGILSDRFGRLPILRIGFPLYIVGGLVAAFSPTIEIMFVARFVTGMGASAVLTTTIAGVRDRFVGDEMARVMSLVLTIFLFTPVLAPFLGIAILSVSSWKWVFLTPPIFAAFVFTWSLLRLEESLPAENRTILHWNVIAKSLRDVLSNGVFVRYTGVTTILFAGLSCYVASSERIIGEIYGRPDLFSWIFAGIGLLMSLCALTNSRLTSRYGARRTVQWLLVAYSIAGSILLAFALSEGDPPQMIVLFTGIAVLMALNIAVEPNSSALALAPMGEMAGMAAAVYGTSFFFIGSAVGAIISSQMVTGVFPLVLGFFLIGVITLLLVLSDKRREQSP
jgi:MFS transporter, DHA1 family, multidrug resistance protein